MITPANESTDRWREGRNSQSRPQIFRCFRLLHFYFKTELLCVFDILKRVFCFRDRDLAFQIEHTSSFNDNTISRFDLNVIESFVR